MTTIINIIAPSGTNAYNALRGYGSGRLVWYGNSAIAPAIKANLGALATSPSNISDISFYTHDYAFSPTSGGNIFDYVYNSSHVVVYKPIANWSTKQSYYPAMTNTFYGLIYKCAALDALYTRTAVKLNAISAAGTTSSNTGNKRLYYEAQLCIGGGVEPDGYLYPTLTSYAKTKGLTKMAAAQQVASRYGALASVINDTETHRQDFVAQILAAPDVATLKAIRTSITSW